MNLIAREDTIVLGRMTPKNVGDGRSVVVGCVVCPNSCAGDQRLLNEFHLCF